jgi:hypothetical protein
MDGPHLLPRFERQPDGSWLCLEPATINRPDGPIALEPGMRFTFGEKHEGFDVAEYLEQLGAQYGS